MFYAKADNKASGAGSMAARARDAGVAAAKAAAASAAAQSAAAAAQSAAQTAAQTAATAAQTAAQGMNTAAHTAAAGVSQGFKQGVFNARGWAAPRLDSAADYITATAAPKVSSALHNAAQQVHPAPQRSRMRSALTWSILGAAIAAALGAAGAVIRQRHHAAMAANTEAEAGEAPAAGAGEQDSASSSGTDAGVNGRVSASGSSGW